MSVVAGALADITWPQDLEIHASLEAVREHSGQWLERTGLDSSPNGGWFAGIDTAWLAAVTYPRAELDLVLVAHDWIAWLIAFDDQVDDTELGRDLHRVREVTDALGCIVSGAAVADGSSPLQVALTDVWSRMSAMASRQWAGEFRRHFSEYLSSYLWETGNRRDTRIPDVTEYLEKRLDTGAVQTCFDLSLLSCRTSTAAPTRGDGLRKAEHCASQVISLTNDIASFEKERAQGDFHNLPSILMKHERLSETEAINRAALQVRDYVAAFEKAAAEAAPGVAPEEAWISSYLDAMRSWIVGNFHWSVASRRFRSQYSDDRSSFTPSTAQVAQEGA
jgi:hypothetical protein